MILCSLTFTLFHEKTFLFFINEYLEPVQHRVGSTDAAKML
jgi:hypothetical protein